MAIKHIACCDGCGREEPMRGMDYPKGWVMIALPLKNVLVCSLKCAAANEAKLLPSVEISQ